ncbi:MAG TPA: zinc ribbon domain-containing protein [Sandaracinaceae bacterium LLY-WYZ-13_1]|nr:zinc ribbon domain-containing protein [Sandaracinaceae bacterium LLY-WYZ-13_1]
MGDATGRGHGDVPGVVWLALVFGTAGGVLALVAATGGLSLPALFIALAAVMLMLGLAAMWQSLRAVFGGGPEALGPSAGERPERTALLEEKATLLRAIKDISFEREVGKISEEDFARLDRAYRRRAKEVLRRLDEDLAPFVKRAERLVARELGEAPKKKRKSKRGRKKGAKAKKKAWPTQACPACGTDNDLDAEHCKECGARLAVRVCSGCGTENDPDAKFCKSCATSLVDEPERRPGAGVAAAGGGSAKEAAETAGPEAKAVRGAGEAGDADDEARGAHGEAKGARSVEDEGELASERTEGASEDEASSRPETQPASSSASGTGSDAETEPGDDADEGVGEDERHGGAAAAGSDGDGSDGASEGATSSEERR